MTPILNVWDAHPVERDYKGQRIQFFTRSALAKALNREQVTIRKMESKGVLCRPRIQDHRGWWLYTRKQIEDLVALAEEENVLDPRTRTPFSDRFVHEANVILNRLP